ncbi:hypothetical protein [Chlorobaculum sp. 24CR]|nr:hypothetical protein [Chlorobaculum sp. 24CR]
MTLVGGFHKGVAGQDGNGREEVSGRAVTEAAELSALRLRQ